MMCIAWRDTSFTAGSQTHATLWNGSSGPIDLGTLGGIYSLADSINNSGEIVGTSYTALNVAHATLWNGKVATDLNSFASGSGWLLQRATGVNDDGWITGFATNIVSGQYDAFLLIPSAVPEPPLGLLMLAGLGSLAAYVRRNDAVNLRRRLAGSPGSPKPASQLLGRR